MNIVNYFLTDINVTRYPNVSFDALTVNFEKQSSMPSEIEKGELRCKITAYVTLENEKKENVLKLTVSYFIVSDCVDDYEQEKTAQEIFRHLAFVYLEKLNSLLRDFNFAPLPVSILER